MDTIIKLLTLLLAVIALFKGLYEYRKAQQWKKAEFLAKEVKEFYADENVDRALKMLDWNWMTIPLFENEIEGRKSFEFKDEMLITSLSKHDESEFTEEETVIRLIMDDFLYRLGMFQNYIESKLIKKEDLVPYLLYWIKILGDPNLNRKQKKYILAIWEFINHYEYYTVIKLLKTFGYNIADS
jgi:hypothetical protein